jgi:hypothetical protein
MKIKLKDGKEIELTEEVIQKVADLIIKSGDLEKPDYPYVGYVPDKKNRVVLFNSKNNGIIISNDNYYYFYHKSSSWDEKSCFKPFSGTITYRNGKPVKTEVNE